MPNKLTLYDRLRAVPLMVALVPLVAGIAAGSLATAIPPGLWVAAAVVCGATAGFAVRWRSRFSILYAGLAVLLFGAAVARFHAPRPVVPRGERVWMEVVLTDRPVEREERRGAAAYGVVTRWRPDSLAEGGEGGEGGGEGGGEDGEGGAGGGAGGWRRVGERLLVTVDTMWRFGAGDRVVFRGYVNPISDSSSSYSRLMWARGYSGRTWITRYGRPVVVPGKARSPALWARGLQAAATGRLRRLARGGDDSEAIAVAAAMTTGDRSGIGPELRQSYSRTGASHLLAVSGLHVGVVFLIINALLWLLPFVRGGHIVKNIVAVAVVWLYAALTGGSPSAVRAAFMFTGAQVAMATSQTRGPVNIMCGTAVVMLAVRPGLMFDIGFQLSFVAVAAIMAWFGPLYRLLESRWRVVNALWATLIVGLVASVATMPLVSHTFGMVSPFGVVLNPLIVTTAYLIVGGSLIWIAAPVGFLEPVFRWVVGGAAWLQNTVVEEVGAVSWAAVEWRMPLWMVFVVYAAMIIFTAWVAVGRTRKNLDEEAFVLPR